jgi:hypothetical protein
VKWVPQDLVAELEVPYLADRIVPRGP